MNLLEIRQQLKYVCKKEGSARAWAVKNKMSFGYVCAVIRGDTHPGKKILKAMGIKQSFTISSGKYKPTPGYVYRHFDEKGELLYIGVTKNIDRRNSEHKWLSDWFFKVKNITVQEYDCLYEAQKAEALAIASENPIVNGTKKIGGKTWRFKAELIKDDEQAN